MIDVQRQIKDMLKIAVETNMMIIEIEDSILKASINNQVINAMNIAEVLEDLWYLIQSNMENQVFQIQQMLIDKLNAYKEKEKDYVDRNIQEIQELYKDKEVKKEEERFEEEEVILIKPYEVSKSTFLSQTSFSLYFHNQ